MKKKIIIISAIIILPFLYVINCKALSCNWETDEDNTYCISNGQKVTGLVKIDGYRYYFDDEGRLMHLKQQVGDKYYFFGRYSGKMQYGWLDSEGNTYYLEPTTGEMKFGWMKLDGDKYYFDEEGHLLHLKQQVGDKYYFFGRYSGKLQKGWLDSEGNRYYLNPTTGEMKFGWMKLDGDKYYFDEEGHLLHLKQQVGDKYYFFGRYSGKLQKGWLDSEGNTYYLNPTTGEMQFGWMELDGDKYYFDEEGHLLRLKNQVDDKYYFFGRYSGKMQKGWLDSEGNRYYLDPTTGEMQFGWMELDGDKYYFNERGQLLRLKQKVDGNYYFFGRTSGKMQKGWLKSEGKVYYLDPETGIMVMNGKYTIDGLEYDFNRDGTLKSQYVTDENGTRYIFSDGSYADDWTHIAGEKNFFNSLGYLIARNAQKIVDISKWNNLNGDIDWVRVKNEGDVDGAIIRAGYRGYGTEGTLVTDPYFATNVENARNAGLALGSYFYSQAITVEEGKEEARMMLNLLREQGGKSVFTLPIVFDTEYTDCRCGRADNLSRSERTDIAIAFLEEIKKAGYTPMIYASKNFLNNNLDMSRLLTYKVWVAQYNHYCTYEGDYDLWQYNSKEYVPGIVGNTDVSVMFAR